MPDIVLKDGTGDAQTIEGATALGVDTVDGGIAVFVSEDVIPEGYEHPSTHPASMITGLAGIATSGKYDDMKNKPFGDITVLPESTVNFSLLDDDLGVFDGSIEGIMDDIVEGETYIITWDGTAYSCVAKDIAEIHPVFSEMQALRLGNATKLLNMGWGEDTGEPFCLVVGIGKTDGVFETDDNSATHTISVYPKDAVRKIKAKYLPDEAATKEYVREQIAGIEVSGGSAAVTETEILPEQTLEAFVLNNVYGAYHKYLSPAPFTLTEGKEYIVIWDGISYTQTAFATYSDGSLCVVIGNTILTGTDSGEPFCIIYDATNGVAHFAATDNAESHTVRIYQKADGTVSWDNVTDKPFYEEHHKVVINANTITDVTFEGLGYTWQKVSQDTLPKGTVVGATLSVTENGEYYTVTVSQEDVIVDNDNCIGVLLMGNLPMGILPFVMVYVPGEITISARGTTETINIPEAGTYTRSGFSSGVDEFEISFDSASIKQIDPEYIPDPPFFDLTAMGLPALTLDGTEVSVECDTTELRAALDKGAVKLSFAANIGSEVTVTGVTNAICMNNSYQCGFVGYFSTPMVLNFTIQETRITGQILALVTAT